MIFSARDPHYREPGTRQALKAYALVVAIEALLYLFCVRQLVHPRIFASYSPRTAIPVAMPFFQFLGEVYALAIGVLEGALPPPEKTPGRESLDAPGGPGMVGPEEFDLPQRGGEGVEIRVLSGSGGAGAGTPGTPTRRR